MASKTPAVPAVPKSAPEMYSFLSALKSNVASVAGIVQSPGLPGAPGLTIFLTNYVTVLSADATGVIADYSPATGQLYVFSGGVDVTAACLLSATATGCTGTVNSALNTPVTGPLGQYQVTVLAALHGKLVLQAVYNGTILNVTFAVSKTLTGATGPVGPGAISLQLSQPALVLAAYANQTVKSFSVANGFAKEYNGTIDETAVTTFSCVGTNCSGTINTATDTPVVGQPIGYYQVTAMTQSTGTLVITSLYAGTTLSQTVTLALAIGGYEIVSALPTTNLFQGRIVFYTADNKLYRYDGASWVTWVQATDVTGQITAAQIQDGVITTAKLLTGLQPITLVTSLPAAGIAGRVFYLTADSQLYRDTGTAWTLAVPAVNITGAIATAQIAAGAVTTALIAANAVTTTQIAANAVTSTQIAANAVTSTQILAGSVSTPQLAANAVTAANIAASTITAGQIAAGTITSGQIAANAITATQLLAGAVTAAKIASGSITSVQIAASTITASNIASATITSSQMAANSITAGQIQAGAVTTSAMIANSITGDRIQAGTLAATALFASSVTAAQIASNTITALQIAANTITANQIQAGTITAAQIASTTITAAQIAAGTITVAQMAANSITSTQIVAGTIIASDIAAGTITAAQIAGNTITAANMLAGTLTATSGIIAALAVNTLQIGTNAVTVPAGATGTAVTYASSNPAVVVVCSPSVTTDGSFPFVVNAVMPLIEFSGGGGGGVNYTVTVQLARSTSALSVGATASGVTAVGSALAYTTGENVSTPIPFLYLDAPAAGTYYYLLTAKAAWTGSTTVSSGNGTIVVLGVKK